MSFLYLRGSTYYYYRRIPAEFTPYTGRRVIAFSLKTDSHKQAIRLSTLESARLENYWNRLAQTGGAATAEDYQQTVKRARVYGYDYIPIEKLAVGCAEELADRVNFVAEHKFEKAPAEAVLGSVKKPAILLSDALEKFWQINSDIKLKKTEKELRKWKNPRRLAVENFIKVNGDIAIKSVTREHMRRLKDWWINRIEEDEYSPATANKNFRHVKAVITSVAEEYGMKMKEDEIREVFSKLEFDDDTYEPRKPFTTDFILNTLFAPHNTEGLQEYEIAMIQVMSETGISVSEMVKILPEDIHLNDPFPHVEIKPRVKMLLKTKHRQRIVPLVGFALDAFKRFPNGFRQHTTDADEVSTAVNSHYREKELFPSEKHSLYSLRHSFQDRLTNKKVDRRIQLDLMGHKYPGEKYGEGGWLETVHGEMKRIQLKPEWIVALN